MAPQLEDRTRFILLMNKNIHQLWMVETFNPINNWTMIGDCRILSINRHQVFCSLHPCDGLSAPGMFQAMQNGQKGPLKAATSQSFSKIPTCYPQPLRKLACHQKGSISRGNVHLPTIDLWCVWFSGEYLKWIYTKWDPSAIQPGGPEKIGLEFDH